jgi:hypothetical protein
MHDRRATRPPTSTRARSQRLLAEDRPRYLRDGKVTEFWNTSTDQYAIDELIG